MSAALARAITLGGLLTMLAVLLWPPTTPHGLAGTVPIAILAIAGLKPARRWGGWVAVLMVPYLVIAGMNLMAGPMPWNWSMAFMAGTVVACLGGLDWIRRTGASLRH